MKHSLIRQSDYVTSNWRGGKTNEIAVFPASKRYIDRDFVWRLSSATIELEESDFTKLPDYDRILMPLAGEVILSFDDEKTVRLGELEQASFSGDCKTKSFGKITDFNLMTRKGISEGKLDVILPKEEAVSFKDEGEEELTAGEKITHAIFCRDGYALIAAGGSSQMLKTGETLILECEEDEYPEYSVMGEGHLVRAMIRYTYKPEDSEPVVIPREKASFDDFRCAFFLANTQFRFADKIFKRIRNSWYDEELSGAIRRLEKMYLTFIISIAGLMALMLAAFNAGMSDSSLVLIVVAWLAVDITLISPLIYLIFLPKPIRKHIKDIDSLTPYEEAVRERELASNERLDKLMKKYKNSGKNLGYDREEKDDLL